jgi:L-threonylcarbamoyladenylate synthase
MLTATRVIKVNLNRIEAAKIKEIAEVLKKEDVIAYPTDTFYGLGASCFSERAIKKVYRLKGRSLSKPLSLLVSGMDMVQDITFDIPSLFFELAENFWPGPLTMVLKASSRLPNLILGPKNSIGIRLPAILWLQKLIDEAGFPITATSANISGKKEIAMPEKVKAIFCGKVSLIADAGKTKGDLASTVLDLTSPRVKILREGAVLRSFLEKYLGRKV